MGGGDGRQVDLCETCKYFVKISHHDKLPQVSWLNGQQLYDLYSNKDVKITIRGIKRCHRHQARGGANAKPKPAFMDAALKSGIDVLVSVDEYLGRK